jgi:hypothetical protein
VNASGFAEAAERKFASASRANGCCTLVHNFS